MPPFFTTFLHPMTPNCCFFYQNFQAKSKMCWNYLDFVPGGGGEHLYFRLDIILVKRLSKHTLNTYFSGMKIDPKYTFLHAFFLICVPCPFQNLSIWPKIYPFFSNFARFCTPKRCTCVHCLVLKNHPNYVIFLTMISNFKYKCPPRFCAISHPMTPFFGYVT